MPVKELLDKIDHGFTWMFHGKEPDQRSSTTQRPRNFKVLSILALIALILQSGLLFLALFAPGLPYRIAQSAGGRSPIAALHPDSRSADSIARTGCRQDGSLHEWRELL